MKSPKAAPRPDSAAASRGARPHPEIAQADLLTTARILTPDPSPELLNAIRYVALVVALAEDTALRAPPRLLVREALQAIDRAAAKLSETLQARCLVGLADGDLHSGYNGRNGIDGPAVTPLALEGLQAAVAAKLALIPPGKGMSNVYDGLGNPRGRLVAARAAARLHKAVRGRMPGQTNQTALSLAAALWRLARGIPAHGADDTDDPTQAWERHLKAALLQDRKPNLAASLNAELLITDALEAAGLRT